MITFIAQNRRSVANMFITTLTLICLAAIPAAANAAPLQAAVVRADQPPFQYKASASVQKGLDLLKKYGLPESALKDLVGILSDEAALTKLLGGLKSIKLTDAQIADFVKEAHALATDKTDPLTTAAFQAFVADGMSISLKDKKIAVKDEAKLAILAGTTSKLGKTTRNSLTDIAAALSKAEPTLSAQDIQDLMFWFALGYDQVYFEVFQVFSTRAELTYYGVSDDVIKTITEHFDDQNATDAELAKAGLPTDIKQTMLDTYHQKLEELGPQACGCAALQAIALTAKAILEENGVSLADQLKIQQAFEKGDLDGAAALAAGAGVPVEQLVQLKEAIAEVQTLAGNDYKEFMAEETAALQEETQQPDAIENDIDTEAGQPPLTEPADHPGEG